MFAHGSGDRPSKRGRGSNTHREHGVDYTPSISGLGQHQKRAPGVKQIKIEDMLKAKQPPGYSDSVGKQAFAVAITSALRNLDNRSKRSRACGAEGRTAEVVQAMSSERIPMRIFPHVHATLTVEQRSAVDLVRRSQSFVLLGKAGTGKTYTLTEAIVAGLEAAGVSVLKCASTGRAATALRGITVHQAVGLGLLSKMSLQRVMRETLRRKYLHQRWRDARVLVIDEFTMLSVDDMQKVEAAARAGRGGMRCTKPFGGLAVVLCGDPCQLQCVSDQQGSATPLFVHEFLAHVAPQVVYLRKVFRQKSEPYCLMLEDVRRGLVTPRVRAVLQSRERCELDPDHIPVSIYARRDDVARRNGDCLLSLEGEEMTFVARLYVEVAEYRRRGRMRTDEGEECGSDNADCAEEDEHLELESSHVVNPGVGYRDVLPGYDAQTPIAQVPPNVAVCDIELDLRDVEAVRMVDKFFNDSNLLPQIKLKVGSQVMLTRNIKKMISWGFVNGLTGRVVGFTLDKTRSSNEQLCPTPDFVTEQAEAWAQQGHAPDCEGVGGGAGGAAAAGGSHKRGRKARRVRAFDVGDLQGPKRDHAMFRGDGVYDLTSSIPPTHACALGKHPWFPRTSCEEFSTAIEGDGVGKGWPVVEFVGLGRYVCRALPYANTLRKLSPLSKANVVAVQLPLILCSAMTVHKVQGMTLRSALVHLDTRMNQDNQAYVALSRVQDESGLYLSALCLESIRADPKAVKFMESVERESGSDGRAKTRSVLRLCA